MIKKIYLNLIIVFVTILNINTFAQLNTHIEKGKETYKEIRKSNPYQRAKDSLIYNLGDTMDFWRYDLTHMPPSWIKTTAVCRAAGQRSVVFVSESEWNSSMNQTDVDTIMHYLETATLSNNEMGIMEMDSLYFGSIPNEHDGDPRVIFFFSNLGQYSGTVFDGYFSAYNQLTEAEAQTQNAHSNECEMLYMSCNPVNPSSISTISVLAHELQHLIHFVADPDEESWVDEGCAEFAMVLFGHPDPIVSFPDNPNNDLTVWDQSFADYVQTMLFFTFLTEQTVGPDFLSQLVTNTSNGINGIDAVLADISFPANYVDLFNQWTIANYVNDTSVLEGLYGYKEFDLPNFLVDFYVASYPAMSQQNKVLNNAANYIRFNNDFNALEFEFSFPDEHANLIFNILSYNNGELMEVTTFQEDTFIFNKPTGFELSEFVMVVSYSEIGGDSVRYQFNVSEYNTSSVSYEEKNFNLFFTPNMIQTNNPLAFRSDERFVSDISILASNGEKVFEKKNYEVLNGQNQLFIQNSKIESGVYFVVFENKNMRFSKKIIFKN